MNYKEFTYKKTASIAIVMLNRPKRLNALSYRLMEELSAVFDEMKKDETIFAVMLTGGEKAFCAGADIKERSGAQKTATQTYLSNRTDQALLNKIANFPKPVIGAIGGVAVGGGCELALSCDLRIASETARFGLPEAKIGAMPGIGGTQRLPRIIGITRAKELLFTGDFIDAHEAYRIGLVNKVVPSGQLLEETQKYTQRIVENAPLSIAFIKRAVNTGMQLDLASALDYESYCFSMVVSSEDRVEGFRSFVEKRKPIFKGR
jgi:enoyl-CoA hydratase